MARWGCRPRHLIAFGIHTLHIGDVVAPLHCLASSRSRSSALRRAYEQSSPGPHRGTHIRTATDGADRGTQPSSEEAAEETSADRAVRHRLP